MVREVQRWFHSGTNIILRSLNLSQEIEAADGCTEFSFETAQILPEDRDSPYTLQTFVSINATVEEVGTGVCIM